MSAFDVYGRYLILGWRWKALTPMVGAPCQLDGFPPRFYEEWNGRRKAMCGPLGSPSGRRWRTVYILTKTWRTPKWKHLSKMANAYRHPIQLSVVSWQNCGKSCVAAGGTRRLTDPPLQIWSAVCLYPKWCLHCDDSSEMIVWSMSQPKYYSSFLVIDE